MTYFEKAAVTIQLCLILITIRDLLRFLFDMILQPSDLYDGMSKFLLFHKYLIVIVIKMLVIVIYYNTITRGCYRRFTSMNKDIVVKPFEG